MLHEYIISAEFLEETTEEGTMTVFRFSVGDICIFTNRGSSGYTGNDGKKCRIVGIKDPEDEKWCGLLDEPGYVIKFLGGSNSFGCRESELETHNLKGT